MTSNRTAGNLGEIHSGTAAALDTRGWAVIDRTCYHPDGGRVVTITPLGRDVLAREIRRQEARS